jgi:hypothetical protein
VILRGIRLSDTPGFSHSGFFEVAQKELEHRNPIRENSNAKAVAYAHLAFELCHLLFPSYLMLRSCLESGTRHLSFLSPLAFSIVPSALLPLPWTGED